MAAVSARSQLPPRPSSISQPKFRAELLCERYDVNRCGVTVCVDMATPPPLRIFDYPPCIEGRYFPSCVSLLIGLSVDRASPTTWRTWASWRHLRLRRPVGRAGLASTRGPRPSSGATARAVSLCVPVSLGRSRRGVERVLLVISSRPSVCTTGHNPPLPAQSPSDLQAACLSLCAVGRSAIDFTLHPPGTLCYTTSFLRHTRSRT